MHWCCTVGGGCCAGRRRRSGDGRGRAAAAEGCLETECRLTRAPAVPAAPTARFGGVGVGVVVGQTVRCALRRANGVCRKPVEPTHRWVTSPPPPTPQPPPSTRGPPAVPLPRYGSGGGSFLVGFLFASLSPPTRTLYTTIRSLPFSRCAHFLSLRYPRNPRPSASHSFAGRPPLRTCNINSS